MLRRLIVFIGVMLTPLAVVRGGQAQQEMADVQIQTVPVADGIFVLMGRGGNIGLSVGGDGAFIVDDQFAPLTEKIQTAIAAVTDQDVRFVLNTHWHGDHTGGNENFGDAGALIVAHENVRERMSVDQFRASVNRTTPASPPAALPVITFAEAMTFHWNGEEIRVTHVAHAHTDGDAVVHFRNANVVHMGDLFFNGRYPFIDVESGGSVDGVIAGANLVLSMANSETRIIPGHGEISTIEGLRAYRDMLVTVRDRIRTMRNDGRTVDEVVAGRPTRDLDAMWGDQPERFVRNVYLGMNGR